ncbi:MAG: hypothetical protein C0458_04245 [Methylobacterium sp.]|nr:hypothetical protein [Methylobacterium sp.]
MLNTLLDALRPVLTEIATILLLAGLGYALKLLKEKAGIDIEASRRDALQAALTNAAGLLVARLGSGTLAMRLDAASPGVADGVAYVRSAVPDAVAHFGLTESEIAEKLVAKLGVLAAPTPAR